MYWNLAGMNRQFLEVETIENTTQERQTFLVVMLLLLIMSSTALRLRNLHY